MRKNIFTSPLTNLHVASPCTQDWNAMIGSDTVRFCGQCRLNVYNLSGMTQSQAEALVREREGRLCVRFYRRADGTVLTQDCPVGWRAIKQRVSKVAGAVLGVCVGFFSGLAAIVGFEEAPGLHTMGSIAIPPPIPVEPVQPVVGRAAVGSGMTIGKPAVMGEIAVPDHPKPAKSSRPVKRR